MSLYLTVLETYREIAEEKGQTKNVAYIDNLIEEEKNKLINKGYTLEDLEDDSEDLEDYLDD